MNVPNDISQYMHISLTLQLPPPSLNIKFLLQNHGQSPHISKSALTIPSTTLTDSIPSIKIFGLAIIILFIFNTLVAIAEI